MDEQAAVGYLTYILPLVLPFVARAAIATWGSLSVKYAIPEWVVPAVLLPTLAFVGDWLISASAGKSWSPLVVLCVAAVANFLHQNQKHIRRALAAAMKGKPVPKLGEAEDSPPPVRLSERLRR